MYLLVTTNKGAKTPFKLKSGNLLALVFENPGNILASGLAGSGGFFHLSALSFLWFGFIQIQMYLVDAARSSNECRAIF